MVLLVIGLILPFCDRCIPYRYGDETNEELLAEWQSVSSNADAVLAEYSADELVLLKGRAMYPRFYKANEGDSGGSSVAKRGLDEDRMVWMFMNRSIYVLNQTLEPGADVETPIADPMDVIVAGIKVEDYIEVLDMAEVR